MEDLIQRYSDAWASRDPDAIVALHTEDTTFRAHTGLEAATGKAAVRQALRTCSPSGLTSASSPFRFEPEAISG